jgi:hypothetical protein
VTRDAKQGIEITTFSFGKEEVTKLPYVRITQLEQLLTCQTCGFTAKK